jgi:uncharacterized UPF0160 family protein
MTNKIQRVCRLRVTEALEVAWEQCNKRLMEKLAVEGCGFVHKLGYVAVPNAPMHDGEEVGTRRGCSKNTK